MNQSTKLKKCFILLTLLSCALAFEIGSYLNDFYDEKIINGALDEEHTEEHTLQPFGDDGIVPEPEYADLDETVSVTNPGVYHDDSPIKLPYSLTEDYYRPKTEKFESVKEYWEKQILFLKWDEAQVKPLFAIDTEKPVYKPGEVVRLTILFYDRYQHKPITLKELSLKGPTLKLVDANRKAIVTLDLEKHIDKETPAESLYPKFFMDSSKIASVVEFKLDADFNGGFYTWEFSSDNRAYQEKTNFFVSAYRNVKEAVLLDFNKDTLLPGDDVMAKVTLKLLGNEAIGANSSLEFSYRVVDNNGVEIEAKTKAMISNTGYIAFKTADDLKDVRSLDVIVTLTYNGSQLTAVKKLLITDIESVRVDFTPGGGKYSMNMENEVYFQAFADVDRTVPIEIENARVIKLCYAITDPDVNVTKPEETKGEGTKEPERPVEPEGPEQGAAEGLRRNRLLESEPKPTSSFWDKFLAYFTSAIDEFLNLNPQKIDNGGVAVPDEEANALGGTKEEGIWANDKDMTTKAGLLVSPSNNYSRLPQNKYSTKKILDAGIEIQSMIRSNEDGKGSFKVVIEPNCSYYLTVTKSMFYTHFFMVNTSQVFYAIDHSDMRLTLSKKVLNANDVLEVKVAKPEGVEASHFRLVIQQNGNIIKEQLVNFGACFEENGFKICDGKVMMNVSDFSKYDGGVFTVQVYRDKLFDSPEQESLVYVYPKDVLKIVKTYDKTVYSPGDTVQLELTIDGKTENLPLTLDQANNDDYFYRVVVSDESAFLQLEKRNLPPTLLTKVFLEKELRGVEGVLGGSHAYLNWLFENNPEILKDEYLATELAADGDVAAELRNLSVQKMEMLIGNQRWRQLFLTGQEMANFLTQIGFGFSNYDDSREYFNLDYWVGCSRNWLRDKKFMGKLEALLPFLSSEIIEKSNYKYGGGGGFNGGFGPVMFDEMPMGEIAFANDELRDEKMMDAPEADTASAPAPASAPPAPVEETGDASTEANNSIELESQMIKENTVFFSTLGWSSSKIISFTLPADVSKFRVSVLAISKDGRYGTHTDFVSSQKKFDVTIDFPLYVYGTESLNLAVNLYNNSLENITVTNDFSSDSWTINANSLKRETFRVAAIDLPKTFIFTPSTGDAQSVTVSPVVKHGLSFKKSKTFIVRSSPTVQVMPDPIQLPASKVPGSVLMKMTYSPMGAPVILSGYETLIREPFGCFEQTSSTTFPMVILMQYLNMQKNSSNQDKLDEMKFKITTNLKKGVKKLLSFETPTGGFEWFGASPGHVTLTAYGLWQFLEMNQLGSYVDLDVIDRTLNWLRGKFSAANTEFSLTQGMDSFGNPPQQISDIYIVFVMSMFDQYQIDYSSIVDPVIKKFESGASSSDPYLLSFVGLLYQNLNQKSKADPIAAQLIQHQDIDSGEFTSAEATITLSKGKSKAVEATAIALLFLIANDSGAHMTNIEKAVDFLMNNMSFGYFFSTQATVLALKALVSYSKYMSASKAGAKSFNVQVDSVQKTYDVEISEDPDQDYPSVEFEEFKDTSLTSVNVNVSPNFTLEENAKYMFSFEYEYGTTTPISTQGSPLKVELSSTSLTSAESFTLKVSNLEAVQQGMVNVVFYKPSNLVVNLNDLETLRKTKKVDYYELLNQNSEIVFYWRGIAPNASYQLDLTLAKTFEVTDKFPAKVGAYLYYDKDGSIVFA